MTPFHHREGRDFGNFQSSYIFYASARKKALFLPTFIVRSVVGEIEVPKKVFQTDVQRFTTKKAAEEFATQLILKHNFINAYPETRRQILTPIERDILEYLDIESTALPDLIRYCESLTLKQLLPISAYQKAQAQTVQYIHRILNMDKSA